MTNEEQQKDDIETMKILFNADINELCNQRRFNDAREMEGIRDRIIKALEQQPCEDCVSREEVLEGLANIAKAKAKSDAQKSMMGRCMFFVEQLSPVTPRRYLADTSQDCISRQAVLDTIGNVPDHNDGMVFEALSHAQRDVALLPSVTPKYTDEEIDKAQAVEQAYVDKMVELAVEETKRPKGKWIVISCEPTDIFKCSECGMRVINPYRYCPNCGAEMSGGEEDETDN